MVYVFLAEGFEECDRQVRRCIRLAELVTPLFKLLKKLQSKMGEAIWRKICLL